MATPIPPTLEALRVEVASLRHYERNPRHGNVELIRESLERHGQYRPIVVNQRTREVLAGNHTLEAARELGWQDIAATFVDVDDEQAARIALIDNRANDVAGYDERALAELLAELPDLDATGYDVDDLHRLLEELGDEGHPSDAGRDTEPIDAPAQPTSRPGDVWHLGRHRLLCGDSGEPSEVARALDGATVDMVWTDPPYGVDHHAGQRANTDGYADGQREGFANEQMQAAAMYDLLRSSLATAGAHTRPGGAIYVAHADASYPEGGSTVFRRALVDAGWRLSQVLIWVKQSLVLSRQDYHWQHEPILYGWQPGAGHHWHGGFTEVTVIDDDVDLAKLGRRELVALIRQLQNDRASTAIREDRPHNSDLHPTMKPVGLVARCIRNSSRPGELVYEPFGGSGTTLIAADNLERTCVAIEIDPAFCDVIVDRWQRHTGEVAKRT